MNRRREPFHLGPNWHVDCRIATDLPDDRVIGAHFLIHVLFGVFAVTSALVTCWLAYRTLDYRGQIKKWDQQIAESAREVGEVRRLQREYVSEATKVDQVYATIRPHLQFSEILVALGHTLPAQVTVDVVEWDDKDVTLRGVIRESKQRAPVVLASYIEVLKKDRRIGPYFSSIILTSLAQPKSPEDPSPFEITFQPVALPPI